jgi:hypothetical protein
MDTVGDTNEINYMTTALPLDFAGADSSFVDVIRSLQQEKLLQM